MSERQLKVLLANSGSEFVGGSEHSLLGLVRQFVRSDDVHAIVTVPRAGSLSRAVEEAGGEWRAVPTARWTPFDPHTFRSKLWRARMIGAGLQDVPAWTRLIRQTDADVVMTNTITSPVPAVASKVARVPHVWCIREFASLDHDLRYALGEPVSQRLIAWLSAAVVANSRAVAAHYSPPVRADRMHVIFPGISVPPVTPNRIEHGELRILFLGRLTTQKGTEVAVRAAAALAAGPGRTVLRMVGPIDAEHREELEQLARSLDASDVVELPGPTKQPATALEWCNVVLVCSPFEAFGRVTAEALTSGRPVVAIRSGGSPELVEDGVTGYLVDPDDVDGLCAALERARDPVTLRELSANAARLNGGRFTESDSACQFADLFASVVRRSRRGARARR
jgi:glycosyltransferase involved in cell wall biosynthesis